jgi:hypothetical protein
MSKGGSQTTSVEVPEYIERAAKQNLSKAEDISRIGYVPYYGPDVAAFSPLQEAAMQNVGGQAGAFGLATPAGGVMSGMPAAQEFAGGIRGYSSAPLYQQSIDELARQRPAQKSFIDSFFIDPITGEYGSRAGTQIDYTTAYPAMPVVTGDTGGTGGGTGGTGGGTPYIPYVPDIPIETPDNVTVVPVDQAVAGDVIAQTDTSGLSDAMIAGGLDGIPSNAGQDLQYYNPDIDYTDAFKSDLTGQYVGTLDPSKEGISAVQSAQESLGLQPVDESFYTETPIYSASDFPLGTSTQGFDFSTYAADDGEPAGSLVQNEYGSTVSTGYGVGQVDPALASAAGYTKSVTEPTPEPVTYDGSSAKNAAVAKILKDKYGWSEETLAEKGYEGYAPDAPQSTFDAIAVPAAEMKNDIQEQLIGNTIGLLDPTYKVGEINNPIQTPTAPEMIEAAPSGTEYNPTTGAYVRDDTTIDVSTRPVLRPDNLATTQSAPSSSSSKIGTDAGDGMVWAKSSTSNALVRKPAPKSSSSKSSSSKSSSAKILCCAYYNLGYLPRDIWRLDQQYGVWLMRNDPALMEGYHAWAAPLADYVQQDTFGGKLARTVMWPIVKSWAGEMAHTMKPEKYKANYAGKAIKFVGEAFSRMCGKLVSRKAQGVV